MEYTIPAVPNDFEGNPFRSLCERRWAFVFSALGWKWEFEPTLDFPKVPRGKWCPDFILHHPKFPVLVEAKGLPSMNRMVDDPDIKRAAQNANAAGYKLLAVGPKPFFHEDTVTIGQFIYDPDDCEDARLAIYPGTKRWAASVLTDSPRRDMPSEVLTAEISHFRMTGFPDGNLFEKIWYDCVRASQWKPRKVNDA